jgi:hypothetical protein
MKLFVYGLILSTFFSACAQNDKKEATKNKPLPITVTVGNNPADQLVNGYMNLKDALVKDNIGLVDSAARLLVQNSLPDTARLKNLSETAKKYFDPLNKELNRRMNAFLNAPDLKAKRTIFRDMTTTVRDMAEKCGSGSNKVYQQHCPMAFDNTGASWLSYETKIRNPYLPKTMLKCGLVEDSLKTKY